MKCSIVMSTRNKYKELDRTLASIRKQSVPFDYEVIVVDDGSTDPTAATCASHHVDHYIKLQNEIYRNPSVARNVGYKAATGEIIIAQSDDVIHATRDAITRLTLELKPGEFHIATVWNYFVTNSKKEMQYTGLINQRPFFFLGSLWRKDLYAVGGNDEHFTIPGYDDDWFGDCLIKGLGLQCVYTTRVEGYHQHHARPDGWKDMHKISEKLYKEKYEKASRGEIKWEASGGPWAYSSSAQRD
jgi:glycosyltransferase involved in cell wall biosynthesis